VAGQERQALEAEEQQRQVPAGEQAQHPLVVEPL